MKKSLLMFALLSSSLALAGPPVKAGPPGKWGGPDDERFSEKLEERGKKAHMFAVVAIAEALELTEAEALRMSEKLKGIEEKRRPMREQMFEAMRAVKAAADGDQAALAQVDANIQKVLEGRAQMAASDKEMFQVLAKDLSPQKKAKLALVLAKLGKGGKHAGRRFAGD